MRSITRLYVVFTLALAAVLTAGCAPQRNATLEEAQAAYSAARTDPQIVANAPLELNQAGESLQRAERLARQDAETEEISHQAYLARQQVVIAREAAQQKVAQQQIEEADTRRSAVLLESRNRELQAARLKSEQAQKELETAQLRTQEMQTQAQRQEIERLRQESVRAQQLETQLREQQAQARQQEMERLRQEAARAQQLETTMTEQQAQARQQEMERLRQEAARAQQLEGRMTEQQAQAQARQQETERLRQEAERARELEVQIAQMKELQAKETPRGLVVSLPDVLFDAGKSDLKAGAERTLEKLAGVLRDNPERSISIEGFTDSTGTEQLNRRLSEQRAATVRRALVDHGVNPERIQTRGYGENYPVASNDTPAGRQLNRRVEIIISHGDERVSRR